MKQPTQSIKTYTHTHGLLKNEHMNRDDILIRIIMSVNMTLVEISAYTF